MNKFYRSYADKMPYDWFKLDMLLGTSYQNASFKHSIVMLL